MHVTVHSIADHLPELRPEVWKKLHSPEIHRASLLAHAAASADEVFVASARRSGENEPSGLAFGVLHERNSERVFAIARGCDIEDAVLTREAGDAETARALVKALLDRARALGAAKMTFGYVRADRRAVLEAAEAEEFRFFSGSSYELHLSGADTFDTHVARLDRKERNWMRRDLRRLEEAGATMFEGRPTPADVEAAWPLYLALIQRKELPFRYRRNFIAELAERASPENICFARCERGGRLLGYVLGTREKQSASLLHLGHVEESDIQLYVAMGAWWLKRELERGGRDLSLSVMNDRWKSRLGFEPIEYRYGFRSLRGDA